jgi:hypothetical protein
VHFVHKSPGTTRYPLCKYVLALIGPSARFIEPTTQKTARWHLFCQRSSPLCRYWIESNWCPRLTAAMILSCIGCQGEWLRLLIALFDEAVDRGLQVGDRLENAALTPALCKVREEALDCVKPDAQR